MPVTRPTLFFVTLNCNLLTSAFFAAALWSETCVECAVDARREREEEEVEVEEVEDWRVCARVVRFVTSAERDAVDEVEESDESEDVDELRVSERAGRRGFGARATIVVLPADDAGEAGMTGAGVAATALGMVEKGRTTAAPGEARKLDDEIEVAASGLSGGAGDAVTGSGGRATFGGSPKSRGMSTGRACVLAGSRWIPPIGNDALIATIVVRPFGLSGSLPIPLNAALAFLGLLDASSRLRFLCSFSCISTFIRSFSSLTACTNCWMSPRNQQSNTPAHSRDGVGKS